MSLSTPHHIWTTCGDNSYEVNKAVVQARMVSGRYRTEKLCRHFSPASSGLCQLCSEMSDPVVEDLHHLLLHCPALEDRRQVLFEYWHESLSKNQACYDIVRSYTAMRDFNFVQLLLDCSVLPEVILAKQRHGDQVLHITFKLTRTWCYSLYRQILKLLGRWS